MFIVTLPVPGQPTPQIFGCIVCDFIAPVATYHLLQASPKDKAVVTTLDDYSRWSEPAFGLLARLLSRRSIGASERRAVDALDCFIFLGLRPETARPIERLVCRVENERLHVSLSGKQIAHVDEQPARRAYPHLADLIEHAARVAVWGADVEGPMPPPLTAVPLRYGDGPPYVLESDMPLHARKHFVARQEGRSQPMPGAHFAHDWQAFIGA